MSRFTSAPLTLLITCSWIIAVSGDTQVNVTTGDNATLHCQAHIDGSISVISWRKTDLTSDEYVFFFRGNRPREDYQLPSFRGRVDLRDPQVKEGDASVVLKNATANDSGKYECVVVRDSGGRRKRAAPFRLSVHLKVEDSGPKAGGSEERRSEERGSEEGGNKDEGNLRGRSGLMGLIPAGLLVFCVAISFVVYKTLMKKKSEQPAADEQQQLSSPEPVEVQVSP